MACCINCSSSSHSDAGFYRYETESLDIELLASGVLEDYKEIVVTLDQRMGAKLHKQTQELEVDVENSIVTITLSQEETAMFSPGTVGVQVNLLYNTMERDVSEKGYIEVWENSYREVME